MREGGTAMYVMHRIGGALLVSKTGKANALKIERE